jgi:CubicO group peptidase (beta-lactamase class C family)
MCNKTMSEYFGERAKNVTIHNLIFMESGILDFEYGNLDFIYLQQEAHQKHLPCHLLEYVSEMPEKDFCRTGNCTWEYEPGTNTSYSSTNFELAGYVLLAHQPEGKNTFDTFDLTETLGLDKTQY